MFFRIICKVVDFVVWNYGMAEFSIVKLAGKQGNNLATLKIFLVVIQYLYSRVEHKSRVITYG
jgi:lipoprotein signal peptidase